MHHRFTTSLILLISLTIAREAAAFASYPARDLRVSVFGQQFGFIDMNPGWNGSMDDGARPFTLLDVGPLGQFNVPVPARTGSGLVVLGVILLCLAGWLAGRKLNRWRRDRLEREGTGPRGFEIGGKIEQ